MPEEPTWDVIVIGAGPAGLSAARALIAGGLARVLVLERNPQAGGLPRFCDHRGWGVTDFHRVWTGPAYARALVAHATSATIWTNASVVAIEPDGRIRASLPDGVRSLQGRAILLATGIRETPRGPRLVGGTRPWGVTTTGAFQEMAISGMRPFRRPVVVGTELVAFSALLTARHAGIRPVAMIEARDRITARRPGRLVARLGFGVPVLTSTTLDAVEGDERVEAVCITRHGRQQRLACDGVIFTGCFVPDAWLGRSGAFAIDPCTGGPVIDTLFRCSAPGLFAAGNVLRPVEHSGVAAREGRLAASAILRSLTPAGLPSPAEAITVMPSGQLKYVIPQRLIPEGRPIRLSGRALGTGRFRFRLHADGDPVAARSVRALPERRLAIMLPAAALNRMAGKTLLATLE